MWADTVTDALDARLTTPLTGGASFPLSHRLIRTLWQLVWLLFARWTPPMFSPWRIALLRLFGARVERGAAIAASTRVWMPRNLHMKANATLGPRVDCYSMAQITIGERSIISQGAFLCTGTHDIGDPYFQLFTKPISIGDDVWIAAEALVAPGVTVGDGAVLSARGCAFGDLEPWTVYRGNPAQPLKARRWRQVIP